MWHVGRRPPGRVEKYFWEGDPGDGKDTGRYTQGSEGKQEVDRETWAGVGKEEGRYEPEQTCWTGACWLRGGGWD